MTFDVNISLEYKTFVNHINKKIILKTNLKRFSVNSEYVPLTYARFSKFLNDEIDNFDFFWHTSLQKNGSCCVNYYRDVESRLCKRKKGDVHVLIVLLSEISSKYEQHYNVIF